MARSPDEQIIRSHTIFRLTTPLPDMFAMNENVVQTKQIPTVNRLLSPCCEILELRSSHDDYGDVVRLGVAVGVFLDGSDELIDDV